METKNRFVHAPINTQLGTSSGEVADRLIDSRGAKWARGGVGLVVLDSTSVEWPRGNVSCKPLPLEHARFIPGMHVLVRGVHAHGARIVIQLNHAGRQTSLESPDGLSLVAPPVIPWGKAVTKEIRLEEIPYSSVCLRMQLEEQNTLGLIV